MTDERDANGNLLPDIERMPAFGKFVLKSIGGKCGRGVEVPGSKDFFVDSLLNTWMKMVLKWEQLVIQDKSLMCSYLIPK